MSTVLIRKAHAGSDSFGHIWPKDGAVVDVDYEQAMVLLAIPDGGFSVADEPKPNAKPKPTPEPEPEVAEPEPSQAEFSEVEPKTDDATDKPAAKKTTARRRTSQS